MTRAFLTAMALIGVWYGLPLLFPSVMNIIYVSEALGNFPIRWLHVLTLLTFIAAFKTKGK